MGLAPDWPVSARRQATRRYLSGVSMNELSVVIVAEDAAAAYAK
jgi:hypothetical protein